jgi:uncharacterized protein DUF3592
MSKLRRPPDSRTLLIGGLILLNVMVLGGGLKVLLDGRRFLATAAEARGVVVDVAKVREYDSDVGREVTRSYPVVEFVTAREQVVRYQPPMGSNPPDYRIGGPLRVLYDPGQPPARCLGHLGRAVERGGRHCLCRARPDGHQRGRISTAAVRPAGPMGGAMAGPGVAGWPSRRQVDCRGKVVRAARGRPLRPEDLGVSHRVLPGAAAGLRPCQRGKLPPRMSLTQRPSC